MAGHSAPCFMVFPDHPEAAGVAGRVPFRPTHTLLYPSGRPFLLSADHITLGKAGEMRVAVIGHCPEWAADLCAEAARKHDLNRLDTLTDNLPGSYHLIASIGGRARVQGSAYGMRRVFRARIDGVDVAADRSDVLAALLGARLDPGMAALRMLDIVPYPLACDSVWEGVEAVEPGDCLLFDPATGRASIRTWWRPPEPELSLHEGAPALREALTAAVDARTGAGGAVSADLSGGLDSTPLCYLAADGPADVTAFTMASDDDADNDLHYARLAAADLPGLAHVVYKPDDMPAFYAEPACWTPGDEPSLAPLSQRRARWRLDLAGEYGSRLHLDGLGGDHVLTGALPLYHDLLRRRPLTALSHLRLQRHQQGLPPGRTIRALADRSSYREWYAGVRARLLGEPGAPERRVFDWEPSSEPPGWITPEARRLIVERLDEAADRAEPLAAHRGQHTNLAMIRNAARETRLLHQLAPPGGPVASSPFLDDLVVHACLRVRQEERFTPHAFKPLVKTAMADRLPADLMRRRDKADGTTLAAEGYARNRRALTGVWETSRLAELGLVDPAPLRRLSATAFTTHDHSWAVDAALAVEWWLRAVRA